MTSAHPLTMAIDPGHDGAAVLLDGSGRRAVGAWGWHRREPAAGIFVWDVVPFGLYHPGWDRPMPSLHAIGVVLADACLELAAPFHLVVEGLFVPKDREPEGALTLAEEAALVYGPLFDGAATLSRPLASTWRASVLRPRWGRSSKEAEAAARQGCIERGIAPSLGSLLDNPHVCEAAMMAVWGHADRRSPAQQALAMGRR